LAHSLNPKYYTEAWINEIPNRQAPHNDEEISEMRNACFRRYFSGEELKGSSNSMLISLCLDLDSIHLIHLRIELIWIQSNGGEFMVILLQN